MTVAFIIGVGWVCGTASAAWFTGDPVSSAAGAALGSLLVALAMSINGAIALPTPWGRRALKRNVIDKFERRAARQRRRAGA